MSELPPNIESEMLEWQAALDQFAGDFELTDTWQAARVRPPQSYMYENEAIVVTNAVMAWRADMQLLPPAIRGNAVERPTNMPYRVRYTGDPYSGEIAAFSSPRHALWFAVHFEDI